MGADQIRSEAELAGLCATLGARAGSAEERRLLAAARRPAGPVSALREAIRAGADPLGDAFCALRSPAVRRPSGATYTPAPIVDAMVAWARGAIDPARVVDPGAGSARFLVAAGRAFPRARLVGIETDPLAALIGRANLAAHGLLERAEIQLVDYRSARLEPAGPTLFLGNPPYVRHHHIDRAWKDWLSRTARAHGFAASQLAGLHVHFFLATLVHGRPGDAGSFVTAAEWLDVNYGQLVRDLLSGPLGLVRLDIIEPTALPFADALTTAAITGFALGRGGPAAVRRVGVVAALGRAGGKPVARARLAASRRWTALSQPRRRRTGIELGELCSVHRGQVTGANQVWIAAPDTPPVPARFLFASVTRARELFRAGDALSAADHLRHVIDLPPELDSLARDERALVDAFLRWARARRAPDGYIASHRAPWWSVRLRRPAPILATYMARRAPAFVRNPVRARHINIAHGIYPREPLSEASLDGLAAHLRATTSTGEGRAYGGGLVKFEPGEMERLLVPPLDVLHTMGAASPDGQRSPS
jgi:adenine-specific DNA-methyltransferase